MPYTLLVHCMANGAATPHDGKHVQRCEFDEPFGTLAMDSTSNPAEAMHFDTPGAAMDYWRTASTRYPLRPDGKPNRPLTGLTVSVEYTE